MVLRNSSRQVVQDLQGNSLYDLDLSAEAISGPYLGSFVRYLEPVLSYDMGAALVSLGEPLPRRDALWAGSWLIHCSNDHTQESRRVKKDKTEERCVRNKR